MFPKLIDAIDPRELFQKIKNTKASEEGEGGGGSSSSSSSCRKVFVLEDESAGDFVRAFQEEAMLRTRLTLRQGNKTRLLPSFLDLYEAPDSALAFELEEADPAGDVHEAKWALQKKYGYKLATNFMPNYARAIYEYLFSLNNPEKTTNQTIRVLDPCAGWGDRMVGLYVTDPGQTPQKHVEYVGFDPNVNLYPGYKQMMRCAMHDSLMSMTETTTVVSNQEGKIDRTQIATLRLEDKDLKTDFELRAQPFEVGAKDLLSTTQIGEASFDVAFTSPPFFEYEVYNEETNPSYGDWIAEFYVPLFQLTSKLLKSGSYFAVYLDDTSAGAIRQFLYTVVENICPMRLDHKIGFRGIYSGRTREILVYRNG